MSLLRYLKKGSGSVLPSPGGSLSRHMPSSSIASANKEVKSVLECRSHKPRSQTSSLLSVDRKREVSKLNVGVVLIIAIREICNHENEFDVNSRNIRPSKITRYTVYWVCKYPMWNPIIILTLSLPYAHVCVNQKVFCKKIIENQPLLKIPINTVKGRELEVLIVHKV